MTKPPPKPLVNPDGRFTTIRLGPSRSPLEALRDFSGDMYHALLRASWGKLLLLVSGIYLSANAFFALIYLAGGDCLANARPGSFEDAFFFSVQTMATIGYGGITPKGSYANLLVTVEALTGLLGVAMVTGLMFSKFSRPSARVRFCERPVIGLYQGQPTLMLRMMNTRHNQIVEAQLRLIVTMDEVSAEGMSIRRLHDLKLLRSSTPVFALSWLVFHPLDASSPLYGYTAEQLQSSDCVFLCILIGFDETLSQTVHTRHAWNAHQVAWGYHYADVLQTLPDGRRAVDYTHFDTLESDGALSAFEKAHRAGSDAAEPPPLSASEEGQREEDQALA